MNDAYYELLVERKAKITDTIAKIAIYIVCLILLGAAFIFGPMAFIVFLAVSLGAYFFVLPRFDIEYEYAILNNELNIDVIYQKSKRKRVCTIDVKDIKVAAPVDSDKLREYSSLPRTDYSSNKPGTIPYGMVLSQTANPRLILFEPDEKLLEMMYLHSPRGVQRR